MSLTASADAAPVHFPANPDKFAFDSEVSAIFENMAERSIPNFQAAHNTHVQMLEPWLHRSRCRILDVGASRGSFVSAIERVHARNAAHDITCVDISPEMCGHLKVDHPQATVRCQDITSDTFLEQHEKYDVVVAHYVLQFLPIERQQTVLHKLMSMVRNGGVFILGHKSAHYGDLGEIAHEQYIQWRMKNGYTRGEIQAKTRALKGSMFPMDHGATMQTLKANFGQVMETFRFMMFSTVFAVK